jgi:hypothetical protein
MPKRISFEAKIGILGDRMFQEYCRYLESYDKCKGKDGPEIFFETYKLKTKGVVQLTDQHWERVWSIFLYLLSERGKGHGKKTLK